jgi:hypothetical protein
MNNMQQEVSNPRVQAEALKRMGRGPDTQLIHMTDSEIGALNGLSGLVFNEPLRTNPETGLPEAGMFKRLLPTILAIGAGAFLGPAAAPMFASMGAGTGLAAGLGAGVAAAGGHLAGQAIGGQELDIGAALMAGAGSGIGAGFGAAGSGGEIVSAGGPAGGTGTSIMNPVTGNFSTAGGADIAAGGFETLGSTAGAGSNFTPGLDAMAAGSAQVTPIAAAPSLFEGAGPGGMRTFSEGFDYLAAEPMKRVALPLGMAALSGELDEPLPEAPSGPSRTPFTPKDFDFTRSRRDLDRDEDGEVTQVDILEVVQELPEGQSSRFYTPGVFTEAAKEGGLLRLQTGGNIQEAIGALTGGGGPSVLPMIAQSVVKPEDEEEESISKGYPVGKAGTAPGMPTTGIAVGGGQPPQPFQEGGLTALELALSDDSGSGGFGTGTGPGGTAPSSSTTEADTGFGFGIGQGTNSGIDSANAANTAASVAGLGLGVPGLGQVASGIAQAGQYASIPEAQRGSLQFSFPSLFGLGPTIAQQHTNLTTQHELNVPPAPAPVQGPPTAEEAEAEAEAAAAAAAAAMAGLGMDLGDLPEDTEPGNPGVPGSQASVAQGIASLASQAMDNFVEGAGSGPGGDSGDGGGGFGSGSGPGSGFGDEGFGGIGGEEGDDSGSGSGGADGAGPGGDGSDSSGADDVKTGGHLGSGVKRLLKLEQGGYLGGASGRAYGGLLQLAGGGSVPYFEGRVMPTGNPTEDGMSDNIPFVIAGRQEGGQMGMQPAVLSPDEYVIPADVVSMLGNGSSTAGANDLDQFINNFRMDKYGRPKQPPEMSGGLSSLA